MCREWREVRTQVLRSDARRRLDCNVAHAVVEQHAVEATCHVALSHELFAAEAFGARPEREPEHLLHVQTMARVGAPVRKLGLQRKQKCCPPVRSGVWEAAMAPGTAGVRAVCPGHSLGPPRRAAARARSRAEGGGLRSTGPGAQTLLGTHPTGREEQKKGARKYTKQLHSGARRRLARNSRGGLMKIVVRLIFLWIFRRDGAHLYKTDIAQTY